MKDILANSPIDWWTGAEFVAVTGCLVFVLRWMLKSFTRALQRIEHSIHVNTITLLNMQHMIMAQDLKHSISEASEDEQVKAAKVRWSQIHNLIERQVGVLEDRIKEINKHDSDRLL